jgi:peptide/nickel transport system substrate-binding protein
VDDLCVKWNSIVPKKLLDEGNDFKVNPIGTGPYKFSDRATAEYLHFVSFEDYRSTPETDGRIENIYFRIIPEPSSRTIALENGEVDLVISVESMDIDRLIENPKTEVLETGGLRNYNLTINTTKPGLDNVLVRKAIAFAINPEAVLSVVLNGRGYVNRGALPPGTLGYSEVGQARYDPELAKQYLEEAGYKAGELSFDIMASTAPYARAAEVIQANLAEIGINTTISSVESAVMVEKTAAGEHDMLVIGNTGIEIPYKHVNLLYHSSRTKAGNRSLYASAELDKLIEAIPTTLDEAEAEALYTSIFEHIQQAYNLVPMFIDYTYTAYSAELTGVSRGSAGENYLDRIRFR